MKQFRTSAQEFCLDYYPLFLTAVRAGLRRGELVALRWDDIQFGAGEHDPNRYIHVQRNYVHGAFTTPMSKKARRLDLSRELRRVLLEARGKYRMGGWSGPENKVRNKTQPRRNRSLRL